MTVTRKKKMFDLKDFGTQGMRLAADLSHPLTDDQQRHLSAISPMNDLSASSYSANTKGSTRVELAILEYTVSIVVNIREKYNFAIRLPKEVFREFISLGGVHACPGVGSLVATPCGPDRVKLCLMPRRLGGRKLLAKDHSFCADLCVSEIMSQL